MKSETEQRNPRSMNVDTMSTEAILRLINSEDQKVPAAIGQPEVLAAIAQVVAAVDRAIASGGHVFYVGAGTSGRLGVLDAAETVPTYGVSPQLFQSLIAGGEGAMIKAVEGAEDSAALGREDLIARHFAQNDFLLGIAASGRTPYVIGALDYARSLGAETGALSCNPDAEISKHADLPIEVVVGPEVVTGSTRMKAGTAQKLVLNMISTTSMINAGKVYGNLMVDVLPTNEKLVDRAKRIIQAATDVSFEEAATYYERAAHRPKLAIVMILTGQGADAAQALLDACGGRIAQAVKRANQN
ncbi:N-acetylmuramic acid 6-phosphate etherase [Lacticaseibacillus absianus]|uniref:N-acetylmuramic acid 6-phosphate etherase n=1 Tax=Lacticaseibacillus absianus TaxID=2729623 RepID=UPI0015CCA089|nr:N-acetylmuramic acid 6-phosphate etherase [Lacticaseibacillus absianus]